MMIVNNVFLSALTKSPSWKYCRQGYAEESSSASKIMIGNNGFLSASSKSPSKKYYRLGFAQESSSSGYIMIGTCRSTDTNSGKPTLDEPSTFTQSCGNFNSNIAIRGRAYYSRAAKEDRSDLMVKKLRYYARFIVVCLLLKKMKLVRDLVMELDKQIVDYTSTYEPDDQLEWSLVLEEIKSFIKADGIVSVLHADSNTIVLSHRLSPLTTPPVEKSTMMNLSLQEILIVGNCNDQVKFSELTMDMFRMLQTLEREPQDEFNHIYDASPAPGRVPFEKSYSVTSTKGGVGYPVVTGCQENGDRPLKRENPHKYLLYKPSFSQVMVFLASGFKELPANGALLLYISADGCFSSTKHPEDKDLLKVNRVTQSKTAKKNFDWQPPLKITYMMQTNLHPLPVF
ncbi:hypothetical protein J6590_047627 [Homalodisca vitripennis]|nr:hypothetical protein J6590_047627 [Homalodisca vitripennis]